MKSPECDTIQNTLDEFQPVLIALRLELTDIVWRDLWRRWMNLRRSFDGMNDD